MFLQILTRFMQYKMSYDEAVRRMGLTGEKFELFINGKLVYLREIETKALRANKIEIRIDGEYLTSVRR